MGQGQTFPGQSRRQRVGHKSVAVTLDGLERITLSLWQGLLADRGDRYRALVCLVLVIAGGAVIGRSLGACLVLAGAAPLGLLLATAVCRLIEKRRDLQSGRTSWQVDLCGWNGGVDSNAPALDASARIDAGNADDAWIVVAPTFSAGLAFDRGQRLETGGKG